MPKRTMMILIVLLIGLTSWGAAASLAEDNRDIGTTPGQFAPDFQLSDLSGNEVKLSDYLGKKVMVNFWTTWCPPCRLEMPAMQAVYDRGVVQILAVNVTGAESSLEKIRSFADDHSLTFPILLDRKMDVAKMYRIRPIPTTFFIDEEGIIRNVYYGPLHQDRMLQYLDFDA